MSAPGVRAIDPPGIGPVERSRRSRARGAMLAIGGYALTRVLGLAILTVSASWRGVDTFGLLSGRWDAVWYARIARHGYDYGFSLGDGRVHSSLAFFPAYPWLERALSLTGMGVSGAGVVVSCVAGLVAAGGMFALGRRLGSARGDAAGVDAAREDAAAGERVGIALAVLWGVVPTAIVQTMAYTESLFVALAVWSLWAMRGRRWLLAGVLAAVAGATRPAGLALVAALWIALAVELFVARRAARAAPDAAALSDPRRRALGWRGWVGAILAPAGWLAYALWAGARTGSLLGYLDIQRQWGNGLDGGLGLASYIGARFTDGGLGILAATGICVGLAGVVALFVLGVRAGLPLPLLVYCAVIVLAALVGGGYFSSRVRLMMPAFPLLLPIAFAVVRLRPPARLAVFGALAVASGGYGALLLLGSGPP